MLSFFVIIFVIQDVHKTYFNISVLEIKIFNKKNMVIGLITYIAWGT